MRRSTYRAGVTGRRFSGKKLLIATACLVFVAGGFLVWKLLFAEPCGQAADRITFDASVAESERQQITQAIADQQITFGTDVTISADSVTESSGSFVLGVYVPVTGFYATRQNVTQAELAAQSAELPGTASSIDDLINNPGSDDIILIPISQLSDRVKLLSLDSHYYLDSFTSGAFFRQARIEATDQSVALDMHIQFIDLPGKDTTLKVHQTGVTALTRLMQRKLSSVGDATYFSAKIGDFLADADITHVSNEVSFRSGCQYSNTLFCSPPEFIETLKASGVNLVELTGNHNNDNGSIYNTESINLYHSLGWHTFGGGLNSTEAAKPYLADQKGSKIAFLGYNAADGPGSGAIAGSDNAGANLYTDAKAQADIAAAKQDGQFVIVNIQYAECQAYPAGYVEFPACDGPISGQQELFRKMIDFGADLVMGSSAHQPQTYELYKDKPIYYGLGNLYFDQTQWPGTERGIILTHYFKDGKLLQTRLTPTVYDRDYQTRVMTPDEADYLLTRLQNAR